MDNQGDAGKPHVPIFTTRAEFAVELTALRERAGLTIRDLARATGLRASTLGGYFSGRHLPQLNPADSLAAILKVCGVTDPGVVEAWCEGLRQVRHMPGPRPASAGVPYRGLSTFQPEDAQWFFGREALTRTLLDLTMGAPEGCGRVLLVVGPSGAGKSSLLRAGLVASAGDRPYVLLTPGPKPLVTLAESLSTVTVGPDQPLLVVVDQLEEVFTLCSDETEQQEFIVRLCELASENNSVSVVLGLRADFYTRVLGHPVLAGVAQDSQLVVGPMSKDELRRAITLPARKANVEIEPGLVELFLRELSDPANVGVGAGPQDAGSLPLLSHALLTTWQAGQGRRLSVADYVAVGGIHGAVAQSAEQVYAGLTSEQQAAARKLLLQMVVVGNGTADTRRRVEIAKLAADDDMFAVLEVFIDSRLLTVDDRAVEICHEALIRAWPRLRTWIEEDRAGLLVGQQAREAAEQWQQDGRDSGALYRGARLDLALQWAGGIIAAPGDELTREFVAHSLRHRRRRAARLYQVIAALAALLVVAAGAGIVAIQQRGVATRERNSAISRLVATIADRVRLKDPALAAQLSVAAYQITETKEARSSLLDTSATPAATRLIGGGGVMQSVALSRDKRTLAAAGADRLVRLWDVSNDRAPVALSEPLGGATDTIFAVAFSPDGNTLAAGGGDKAVYLWDISNREKPTAYEQQLLGPAALVYSLAFSPDGAVLAAGSGDNMIHLWETAGSGAQPVYKQALAGASKYVQAIAFSPNGQLLAAGSADKTVRLWDMSDRQRPVQIGPVLDGPQRTVYSVAFSPDSRTLAAGSGDGHAYLWDVSAPARPQPFAEPIAGPSGWVNAITFSESSHSLAFATSASEVRVVDLPSRRLTAILAHPGPVTSLVFGKDEALITGAADGTARIWHPPWPVLSGQGGVINAVTFNRTGSVLAIGSSEAQLWDTKSRMLQSASMRNAANTSTTVAHHPRQPLLAIGSRDGTIQLWDIADPQAPQQLGSPLAAHTELVESAAFSPDGRYMASGGDDNQVRLWNMTDPGRPVLAATLDGFRSYVYSVVFSPDGTRLAAASIDKTVRMWDISSPQPRQVWDPLAVSDHYALAVAFSPDGQILAVGSADKAIRLYDLGSPGTPRQIGATLGGPTNYVYALSFTPDGRRLAAASTDETVWIWDVSDRHRPEALATLTVPADAVYSVAYHPDGHTLAAGGAGKTVWLWKTDPGKVIEEVCSQTGDPMTPAEWKQYVPTLPYRNPCAST